jgi:putative membrane protein insertion efficiency factor
MSNSSVPEAASDRKGLTPIPRRGILRTILYLFSKGLSKGLILFIRAYQLVLSPYLGRQCRYLPTCSAYTVEAIEEWGPLKGIWMGAKRIGRCHPWGGSGYDPVPRRQGEPAEGSDR